MLNSINQMLTDTLGPLGPLLALGFLGALLVLIALPALLGALTVQASDDEILRLLEALQLDPALSKRAAGTLSVGQQQRVAAARALIGRPAVLLADEPTSALDRQAATAFLQLMSAQCRAAGTTVLVVSHDESLQPLFDRTIALSQINHAGGTHA